jgi:hypothetical protein
MLRLDSMQVASNVLQTSDFRLLGHFCHAFGRLLPEVPFSSWPNLGSTQQTHCTLGLPAQQCYNKRIDMRI